VLKDTVDEFTDMTAPLPVHTLYQGTEFIQALTVCKIPRYLPLIQSVALQKDHLAIPSERVPYEDFRLLVLAFLEEHLIDCLRPVMLGKPETPKKPKTRKKHANPRLPMRKL
jgi:hypothetical protein